MALLTSAQLGELLTTLLPADCAVHAETGQPPAAAALLPEELEGTKQMVPGRLQEFMLGRYCARQAMLKLNEAAQPIPRGADRAPQWPAGLVGSITHTGAYAAAAVAREDSLAGIGIDIETTGPLEAGSAALICRPDENPTDLEQAKLLFGIKESIYKAIYPTVGKFVDFQEMEVCLNESAGSFTAIPHIRDFDAARLAGLQGKYLLTDELLLCSAWLVRD